MVSAATVAALTVAAYCSVVTVVSSGVVVTYVVVTTRRTSVMRTLRPVWKSSVDVSPMANAVASSAPLIVTDNDLDSVPSDMLAPFDVPFTYISPFDM